MNEPSGTGPAGQAPRRDGQAPRRDGGEPRPDGRAAAPLAIADVRPQQRVLVAGVIQATAPMSVGGSPAYRCELADDTGQLDLIFLGRLEVPGLTAGRRCSAEGTAALSQDRIVLWNPRYTLAAEAGPEPSADGPPGQGPAPGPVLLVDSDPALRRVVGTYLEARGFRVEVACSAAAAVDRARLAPRLIVVDLGLPDGRGPEAVAALRDVSAAPIIAISAEDSALIRLAAIGAGADAFVVKPFAIDMLLAQIRDLLAAQVTAAPSA
jgi:CheY-like chemotaxis protein